MPNYFLIFRFDSPSNYNFVIDEETKKPKDSTFDFKTDILDKAVLIKTFDLREDSVLGNYIRNYVEQEEFEFDKSMYVYFSNSEVTYYGINKTDGVFENKVESFENELLGNDNTVTENDKWFTEGFERNGLIFPYIMNIEYLFNDETFTQNGKETYDFARYIGVYCNTIEFGEFETLDELSKSGYTQDNAIYYFEDIKDKLHRYTNGEDEDSDGSEYTGLKIDGKDSKYFDTKLITGFEKDRINGYAEPLDIYEGFINRAQYGFEILKPLEPGDWIGIEYKEFNDKGEVVDHYVECYFADNKNYVDAEKGVKTDMLIGEYHDFRFSVSENSTVNDIAEALAKCINSNIKGKFEARYSDNVVAIYAKREGVKYNGSKNGGTKILIESSLIYNRKVSLPISKYIEYINANEHPIEDISYTDGIVPVINSIIDGSDSDDIQINYEKSSFGNYYKDIFKILCSLKLSKIIKI